TIGREEQAHLQQLVRDLVQTDSKVISDDTFDQTPYIIKQVFQSGREEAFGELLSGFALRKEHEIEKVCALHYQEFVQSIDQLLKVRAGTSSMRDKILSMNHQIQETGDKTVEKKKELIENKRKLVNIELALESVQSCLFVLDICNRITTQIASRKYFSALRMVQEIQSTHFKLIQSYSFSKLIIDWIPQVQQRVRASVLLELKEWYSIIKENAARVGSLAMNLTLARYEKINKIINSSSLSKLKSKSIASNIGKSMELAINEELANQNDLSNGEDIQLDFTPLFQCIHIHDVLGKRTQLKIEFEENRRLQADQLIKSSFSLKSGSTTEFNKYMQQIAGFFVIEATVMTSTQDFRSRSNVEAIWELATNKMGVHMIESLSECDMPELFLEMKESITAFMQTMSVYGYAVSHLNDLMLSLLDRFGELVKTSTGTKIFTIINEEDDYLPMSCKNPMELAKVQHALSIPEEFVQDEDGNPMYPVGLPFSRGVFLCAVEIGHMIDRFYRFSAGFTQQSNEIDDLMKKVLENVLFQYLNATYRDRIVNGGLSVAIQLMINSQWLAHACADFEQLLQEKRFSTKGIRVPLASTSAFEETYHMAENRIFQVINHKIDTFVEVVDYNWTSNQSRSSHSPSYNDLAEYLEALNISALTALPDSTKSKVFFEAFEHLSSSLKDLITTSKVNFVTIPALESLEKDVIFLESFLKRIPDAISVSDCFVELRQLILYGKSANYEEILNLSIKSKKYSRVEMQDVVHLLEKLKNYDTGYFSKASPAEKQLKKTMEDVMKALRQYCELPPK
ncbi:exocyst complex subunit Sec15-like-domain-containing protein, partial [Gorgonomyces haynaldii]